MGLISPGSGVRAPPGAVAFCFLYQQAVSTVRLCGKNQSRSYSVKVITKDFESFDPGSSPGRTFVVPVAQLDKASDYESEDWGFKSLQEYFFCHTCFLFEGSVLPHGVSFADIAQLGERQTEDLKVPGSIPGVGICNFFLFQRTNALWRTVLGRGR